VRLIVLFSMLSHQLEVGSKMLQAAKCRSFSFVRIVSHYSVM